MKLSLAVALVFVAPYARASEFCCKMRDKDYPVNLKEGIFDCDEVNDAVNVKTEDNPPRPRLH